MIKYLKVKKYKGISEIVLSDLGNINILCGKNNSGKTTIFEALNKADANMKIEDSEISIEAFRLYYENLAIGIRLDKCKSEYLKELLYKAQRNIDDDEYQQWVLNYIKEIENDKKVIYFDEYEYYSSEILSEIEENYRKNFDNKVFYINLTEIVNKLFKEDLLSYKPLMIPHKRWLESETEIKLDQKVTSAGSGILNRLFLMKNQDLDSELHKKFKKISDAFKEITEHKFNIIANNENKIRLFFKGRNNEKWILSKDCGAGLSEILVMLALIIDFKYTFICIEEPENHLHPEIQKRFLTYIRKFKSKQFMISTHSNVFLDIANIDKIFYVKFKENISVSDETSRSKIIHELGYPIENNLVADVIVLTEGPTDIPIISTICEWIGINDKYNIKFWPMGGDIMASLDLSIFAEKNNVIALIDSDPGSQVVRTRFMRNCKKNNIICHMLKRYSIENYLTLESIKKCFDNKILDNINELDNNMNIDEQLGLKKKNKTIKIKNSQIISAMKLEDVKETDLYDFCEQIKVLCETVVNEME